LRIMPGKRALHHARPAAILSLRRYEDMFFPLSILRVKIVRDGQRKRNLFVPVILVVLGVLLLTLLMTPLLLIAAIFQPHAIWKMLKAFARLAIMFFKTRGTHIELNNQRDNILIYHK